MKLTVKNATEMENFGAALKVALKRAKLNDCLVFLQGDLGAGKTTFVQGFIQSYGIKDPVTSPTYTLVESYESSVATIHHFDLYRLDDPEELEAIGIRDYFIGGAYALVEWPDKGKGFLPKPDLVIEMHVDEDAARTLDVRAQSARGEKIVDFLEKMPIG